MINTDEIIARLILSTKRKKRIYNLIEIANDIKSLKNELGNLKEVSNIIGISSNMLTQFLCVYRVSDFVKELIIQRKIDSVVLVRHISKFLFEEQNKIAIAVINNEISPQDIRILFPLRKEFPEKPIEELFERIIKSKNIKISKIVVHKDNVHKSIDKIKETLESIIGKENLIDTQLINDNYEIKLSKKGEHNLRDAAKNESLSLQKFLIKILN